MHVICKLTLFLAGLYVVVNGGENKKKKPSTIGTKNTALSSLLQTTTEINLWNYTDDSWASTTEVIETTTCSANSTCNTTEFPPTTETPPVSLNRNDISFKDSGDICTCNLKLKVCDLNCCCDPDCTWDQKQIFSSCYIELNRFYDTRYCEYMQYMYLNNTPFEWKVNQNGLFCIVKSNLPPFHILQRKQPLKNYEEIVFQKQNRFQLKFHGGNKKSEFEAKKRGFRFGDKVWMVRDNRTLLSLGLPKNTLTNICIFNEEVLIFKDIKYSCSHVGVSEDNRNLSLETYFHNLSVVSSPDFLNKIKDNNFKNCPRSECLPIETKICTSDFSTCANVSNNDIKLKLVCSYDIAKNWNSCKNVVKKIRYNFYHNGTHGITKTELQAVLELVSYSFGKEDFIFEQTFEVNFFWWNQTRNISLEFSGNPGYLKGKPIIQGLAFHENKTEKISRKGGILKNFLVLAKSVEGKCVLNEDNFEMIQFGFNSWSFCKLNRMLVVDKKAKLVNFCINVQKAILENFNAVSNMSIGMFGNANALNPKEWIRVFYNIDPQKILNRTRAVYNFAEKTIVCSEIATFLTVDILHARIDFSQLLNQEKILGISYTFENFINLTFQISKMKNDSLEIDVQLQSKIMFYDITSDKKLKFVDPPSFEIRLPYDFFYPFVRIGNGGNIPGNYLSIFILCTFSIVLVKI